MLTKFVAFKAVIRVTILPPNTVSVLSPHVLLRITHSRPLGDRGAGQAQSPNEGKGTRLRVK